MTKNHITVEEFKASRTNKKKPGRGKESLLQERCVTWFRYNFPHFKRLLFSVPNGGPRSDGWVKVLEGLTKGVSDLRWLIPGKEWNGLCIEMKVADRNLSEEQLSWGVEAMEMGYRYVVIRSFEEFKELVYRHLGV